MTSVATGRRPGTSGIARIRGRRPMWLPWGLTLCVAGAVTLPIAMVLYKGFDVSDPGQPYRFGFARWETLFDLPAVGDALFNTATITITRVAIGLAVAVIIAWVIARTDVPGARLLEFGFWLGFFMPSLAVVQGWVFLAGGPGSLLNLVVEKVGLDASNTPSVYSYAGIVWVHLMHANITLLVVMLIPVFRSMDGTLDEAARMSGASFWQSQWSIFLPLMKPVIVFLAVLGSIKAMQSYEIERILGSVSGIDVYATLLVRMIFSEPPFVEEGSALSALVLIVLVPLIVLQRRYTRGSFTTVSGRMSPRRVKLGRFRYPIFGLIFGLIGLITVVPALSVLAGSVMRRWGYFEIDDPWTLASWEEVLSNDAFRGALQSTLIFGLIAGLTGALIMYGIAYIVVRGVSKSRHVLDFMSWMPWAVPGVLLSLGLSAAILEVPALRFLNGTAFIVVVALILYSLPTGSQLLRTSLLQMGNELEESGRMAGASAWSVHLRIVMPIVRSAMIAAGLVTFVAAMTEISGILLLASTDTRTLSLLSLDYLTGANFEAAAVVNCVLVIMAAVVALLARAFDLRMVGGEK